MLNWAVTFFLMAIIASMLGFGGMVGTFVGLAKLMACLFVILFAVSLIYALIGSQGQPPVV